MKQNKPLVKDILQDLKNILDFKGNELFTELTAEEKIESICKVLFFYENKERFYDSEIEIDNRNHDQKAGDMFP